VAQQGEDLVLVHVEGQVIDHNGIAVGLGELADRHRGRAEKSLIYALVGDAALNGATVLHGRVFDAYLYVLRETGGARTTGVPVAVEEEEVPGPCDAYFGGPHLREVPREPGIDEDVGEHDAADGGGRDAVVALQEGARRDLQGEGREQAADDLRVFVGDREVVHSEHGYVDHVEPCAERGELMVEN
jgi:hypothetical protein